MNQVQVTLTGNIVDSSLIYPYARHMQVTQLPIYEVPLYQLKIEPNTYILAFDLLPHFVKGSAYFKISAVRSDYADCIVFVLGELRHSLRIDQNATTAAGDGKLNKSHFDFPRSKPW